MWVGFPLAGGVGCWRRGWAFFPRRFLVRTLILALALCFATSISLAADEPKETPASGAPAAPKALPNSVISLEFEIIEVSGAKEGLSDDELIAKARAQLTATKGRGSTRVRLTTVDGISAMAQFGQREAIVTGRTRVPAGAGGGFGGGGAGF